MTYMIRKRPIRPEPSEYLGLKRLAYGDRGGSDGAVYDEEE